MSNTGNKRNAERVKASGVICDCKVPFKLKGIFYYVVVNVGWDLKERYEHIGELRMLR